MLVSATEMLKKAKAGHYAVGQFNINNLEWTKAVLLTAQELQSPVILGVSEGAGKYMTGFETVAAMVKAMDESLGITVPVALHLDHGTYEGCYKCVKAGFTVTVAPSPLIITGASFASTVSTFLISFSASSSLKYLLHLSQNQYVLFPSFAAVAACFSTFSIS